MTEEVRFMSSKSFRPDQDLRIWLNGRLVPTGEAVVSVFDHGLLYGDGVFEGIAVYGARAFALDAHVKRLYASAATIRLDVPIDKPAMVEAINATINANGLAEKGYVRPILTRGVGTLGLSPRKTCDPQVIIIADAIELYPPEMYEHGMAVITSKRTRTPHAAIPSQTKSMNYLNNILAKIEALEAGRSEAIMLNADGHVAEATADNVFVVRDGTLMTPPISAGVLPGITRRIVIEMAAKRRIPAEERLLRLDDLLEADECFLTGTGAEVIGVTRIDEVTVGTGEPGPITRQIEADYKALTADPDYSGPAEYELD